MSRREAPLAPVVLSWFPLVVRPRPPCRPLAARAAELTSLAASPGPGTAHERASRAAEVLNKAALITSDCGLTRTALELCRRQHELFSQVPFPPAWATPLALQPLLNIPRQLIREGHGLDAYQILEALYQAAREKASAVIAGQEFDLSTITRTPDAHKTACTQIWAALLADGTRALGRAGLWKQAANHATTHRGIGKRLLDGRQAAVLALIQDGQLDDATAMTDQAAIAESWEQSVGILLRVLCLRAGKRDTGPEPTLTMLATAAALAKEPNSPTALGRARIYLAALDLSRSKHPAQSCALRADRLISAAADDAYIARDILALHEAHPILTDTEVPELERIVRAAGLDAGTLPEPLHDMVSAAVDRAETTLNEQLRSR